MATNVPVTLDTLIVVKILFQGHSKKFKIPLRDLGPQVLPDKLRTLLLLRPDDEVVFERYSDSAGAYVTLDADKPQVYKTLFRAAKAKLKLRLRATVPGEEPAAPAAAPPAVAPEVRSLHRMSADTLAPQAPAHVSPVIAHSPLPPHIHAALQAIAKPEAEATPTSPPSYAKDATPSPVEVDCLAPRSLATRQSFFASQNAALAFRPKEDATQCSWVVFCNNCEKSMKDEHFHCSICDHGDYDLCPSCVDAGTHCPGAGHWMVKRFVRNGCVVNSTTERVGPKAPAAKPQAEQDMPGAFTTEKQPAVFEEPEEPTRTCNCCVKVLPEREFVTCSACDDYDICVECLVENKHGHHPGHAFEAATKDTTLHPLAGALSNTGRNVRHSAVCDGCEKFIYGVRHKCLNCPDWDFCSECIKNARYIHPRHRFVPIYEPLAEPVACAIRHYGIYCDGPLCKEKENMSYIEGVRYKCAVCHDTDFCANCEAHPTNRHNRTHPLIKFKTPVRNVSVTTMSDDKSGVPVPRLGDQPPRKSASTETTPVAPSTNAATQVQTIVDMKPSEDVQPKATKEKIEIRDLLSEPVHGKLAVQNLLSGPAIPAEEVTPAGSAKAKSFFDTHTPELNAHFIRETILDGSKIAAEESFVQVWTLRNPGPNTWPAGCSVRHVGGDNMLNLDNTRPLSQSELAEASESNVIGRPVQAGEEISFRVVMKAPKREGVAISYWRLKTSDGTPFGHRLWCDIQVVAPSSPVTSPAPQSEQSTPTSTQSRGLNLEELHAARRILVERVFEERRKQIMGATKVEQTQCKVEANEIKHEETTELPVQEKPQASGMIFPQLDKESPASSTHEAVNIKEEAEESHESQSDSATVAPPSEHSEAEFFEDAESVDADFDSIDSNDGFLTDDEEYDMVTASDEDMP
ncbi:hypothetical protein P154DRAFT_528042 [Amniculicola lignicola CBS 123094]|uniref:ZZ-type domain-containing protein n=1 Tax=Amniculicola lignicola CBS 123094 TaxID=1392246 RepID=A0A6A5W620_9PLEO|nr:hypothetical protein P154DRAFT_528042 [Amniculicola lignicola CBS 123094]